MDKVDRNLLEYCIYTLVQVQNNLKATTLENLIRESKSGKVDSLCLDIMPENTLNRLLIENYDHNIVLITEERGDFNFQRIAEAECVIFCDPTDRSKHFKRYIEHCVEAKIAGPNSTFQELMDRDHDLRKWIEIDKEGASTFSPALSSPCCSLTVVKRGKILFTILLNYFTEEVFIGCREFNAHKKIDTNMQSRDPVSFREWPNIEFPSSTDSVSEKKFSTFLGKRYKDIYSRMHLFDETFKAQKEEPGGPARILYLSDLNDTPLGFILSNGEKIGEWLGWLAFTQSRRSNLVSWSIYSDTFFARDQILMTPTPHYSILELRGDSLYINFDKLKYFTNPSRYRETILVTRRGNGIVRDTVEGLDSRRLI